MADPQFGGSRHALMGVGGGAGTEIAALFTMSTGSVEAGLNRMQNAFGQTQRSIAGFVGAVSFALVIKQITELAAESIKFQRIGAGFQALADRFHMSADTIVDDIKRITQGQIATVHIMESVNKALTLLPPAAERMTELAIIATGAAAALGLDVRRAFDDITTGIGRASPKILDNLGIVVNAREAYRAYAAQIGKTVTLLGAEEKQIALLNQVIDRNIDRFGEIAKAVRPDIFQQTASALTDLRLTMGKVLSYTAKQFLQVFSGFIDTEEKIEHIANRIVAIGRAIVSVLAAILAMRTAASISLWASQWATASILAQNYARHLRIVQLGLDSTGKAYHLMSLRIANATKVMAGNRLEALRALKAITWQTDKLALLNRQIAAQIVIQNKAHRGAAAARAGMLKQVGIFAALAAAIYIVVTAFQSYNKWLTELQESVEEFNKDMRTAASSAEGFYEKLKELQEVNLGSLVDETADVADSAKDVIDVLEAWKTQTKDTVQGSMTQLNRYQNAVSRVFDEYRKVASEAFSELERLAAEGADVDVGLEAAERANAAFLELEEAMMDVNRRGSKEIDELTHSMVTDFRTMVQVTESVQAAQKQHMNSWVKMGRFLKGIWITLQNGWFVLIRTVVNLLVAFGETLYGLGQVIWAFFDGTGKNIKLMFKGVALWVAKEVLFMAEKLGEAVDWMIEKLNLLPFVDIPSIDLGGLEATLAETRRLYDELAREIGEIALVPGIETMREAWGNFGTEMADIAHDVDENWRSFVSEIDAPEIQQDLGYLTDLLKDLGDTVEELGKGAQDALEDAKGDFAAFVATIAVINERLERGLLTPWEAQKEKIEETLDFYLSSFETWAQLIEEEGLAVANVYRDALLNLFQITGEEVEAYIDDIIRQLERMETAVDRITERAEHQRDMFEHVARMGAIGVDPMERLRMAEDAAQRLLRVAEQERDRLRGLINAGQKTEEVLEALADAIKEVEDAQYGAATATQVLVDALEDLQDLKIEKDFRTMQEGIQEALEAFEHEGALAAIWGDPSAAQMNALNQQIEFLEQALAGLGPESAKEFGSAWQTELDSLRKEAELLAEEIAKAASDALEDVLEEIQETWYAFGESMTASVLEQDWQAVGDKIGKIMGDTIGDWVSERIEAQLTGALGARLGGLGGGILGAGLGWAVGQLFGGGGKEKALELAEPLEVVVMNPITLRTPPSTRALLGSSGTIFSSRMIDLIQRGGFG